MTAKTKLKKIGAGNLNFKKMPTTLKYFPNLFSFYFLLFLQSNLQNCLSLKKRENALQVETTYQSTYQNVFINFQMQKFNSFISSGISQSLPIA